MSNLEIYCVTDKEPLEESNYKLAAVGKKSSQISI